MEAHVERRQTLGYVGSITLMIGVFTPIVSLPIVGSQNYFQNGHGDGMILLVLAAVALWGTVARQYAATVIPGLISLALLVYAFVGFQSRIEEMRAAMDRDLAGNPFKGLGEVMLQSVHLDWGWAVLVAGSVLLILTAAPSAARAHAAA